MIRRLREGHSIAHLHFGESFLCFKANLWPGSKGIARKKHRGERILPGDPPWLPQNGAGRSGARPGAPTSETPCSRRKNGLPAQPKKRGGPHDFLRAMPLFRAGHGLKYNRLYTYWAKREGVQGGHSLLTDTSLFRKVDPYGGIQFRHWMAGREAPLLKSSLVL